MWPGLRYGASTPCRARATAAIMRSEPIAMMRSTSPSGIGCVAQRARSRRRRIACTMLPTNARSCGRSGAKPGASSQHQTTTSAARLDLRDLVAVDHAACSRRSRAPAMPAARNACADREQHRVAEPAADQQHGFVRRRSRSACRSAPSARPARRASAARTGRTSRPSRARSSRPGPRSRSTQAPVSARPSIASGVPSARAAPASRSSAADRTARAGSARAASGARTTTSTIVGRQPVDLVHASRAARRRAAR